MSKTIKFTHGETGKEITSFDVAEADLGSVRDKIKFLLALNFVKYVEMLDGEENVFEYSVDIEYPGHDYLLHLFKDFNEVDAWDYVNSVRYSDIDDLASAIVMYGVNDNDKLFVLTNPQFVCHIIFKEEIITKFRKYPGINYFSKERDVVLHTGHDTKQIKLSEYKCNSRSEFIYILNTIFDIIDNSEHEGIIFDA